MKKALILCLLAFCFASAAKKSFAVMPCVGDFDAKGLERLRNKVEEVARATLPLEDFRLIPFKNVREEIGDKALFNACKEGGVCFGDLTAQVNADYGAWCMVNKYGNKLALTFQLYSVGEKDLIHTKEYDSYNSKNVDDIIDIIKREVPVAIKEKILGVKTSTHTIEEDIGGTDGSYELDVWDGKKYDIVVGKNQEAEMEHKSNMEKLIKHTKEQENMKKKYKADKDVNSSNPSRFDKIKFGIGVAGGAPALIAPEKNIISNTEIDTVNYIWNGLEGSLGMAINIPIVSTLTFNPELYFVYREISYSKEFSSITLDEFVLNIPLIITLAWQWLDSVPDANAIVPDAYFEAGASLDMPLSTSVNSNSAVLNIDRKNRFGVVLGFGFLIGDFSLGLRANIDDTYIYGGIIARYLI